MPSRDLLALDIFVMEISGGVADLIADFLIVGIATLPEEQPLCTHTPIKTSP